MCLIKLINIKIFLILLLIPLSIFSDEDRVIVHDGDYYYYAERDDLETDLKESLEKQNNYNNYFEEDDLYERKLYESCEELANYEPKRYKNYQLFNCSLGKLDLSRNKAYKPVSSKLEPKSKKDVLGISTSNFIEEYKDETSRYGDYTDIEYTIVSLYYEHFISKALYFGGRLGLISRDHTSIYDIAMSPYLGFSPFYMLKYINVGINTGFLISSQLKDEFSIIFDVYLGVQLSNTIKINIEYGSHEHLGFSIGVLF